MNIVKKHASETFEIEVNFSNDMAAADSINSITVSSRNLATGISSTSSLVSASSISAPAAVLVTLTGGTADEKHRLTVVATMATGAILEEDIFVHIESDTKVIIVKQPNELFVIAVDFTNDLASGESLSTSSTTVIDVSTDLDVTTTIKNTEQISGNEVQVACQAGTDESEYRITVSTTTSDSNVFVEELMLFVRET